MILSCVCVYKYIYIERERECINCIYIYIYRERETIIEYIYVFMSAQCPQRYLVGLGSFPIGVQSGLTRSFHAPSFKEYH